MHTNGFCQNAPAIEALTPGFEEHGNLFSPDILAILNDICAVTASVHHPLNILSQSEQAKQIASMNLDIRLLVLGSDYNCPSWTRTWSLVEESLSVALLMYVKQAILKLPRDSK